MYRLASRTAIVSIPQWRSMSLWLRSSASHRQRSLFPASIILQNRQLVQISCFKNRKVVTGGFKTTKRVKTLDSGFDDKDTLHITWWKQRLQLCRKPSTVQLINRLVYSNILGVDSNLKNGSLKEGSLNWEMLQFKSKFPREILLCRVGDFYEAIGIDACMLVEYAGLNPFGGLRSDSIPRAGCPVVNLRQTLDDLTRNGYSVCIVEEVQGPTQARSRKGRFISGHAHPGSPYVYGLVGGDHDLEFPEPMPVIGISRSARGYCMVLVLETMKTYSLEDGLTEEALVTKLRTCHYHHLFLHTSLRQNSSGTCRWGEYGEGGLLWAECNARNFEWFESSDPLIGLLPKVKELYGLDDEVAFRNVSVCTENRPHPLHLGTATQIGAIQTDGIPSLLKVLLPANCTGLPILYIRDLLLNPPTCEIAITIQATCRLMNNITCSIPDFTCFSPAKLVKLLEMRETNHIEFCRIKNVLDEILQMHCTPELCDLLKLLMDPTWVSTGLKINFETLVTECEWVSKRIGEMITLDGESDQKISSFELIPSEFFEDMESSWKGRVKRIHIEEEYAEVDKAAEALSLAVSEDFFPIISRIRAITAPLGGPKGEITYSREHEAVWFKGKRFTPTVWAGTPGEEQIKHLKASIDSKGRKVGEEWFTTPKIENALARYHEAGDKAKARVLELLRQLSLELQGKINILVFASMLLIIAKALFAHVSEARRRKWVFPTIMPFHNSKDEMSEDKKRLKLNGLQPYWLDIAHGSAVDNTVDMQSLFLLTGPNGGGKSSLLRSICAASLLGMCGLLVPAESALIPHFDSIMLHMKSYDSPADGKSSFQVEMSEIRSIITQASPRSLVLIDEICRGTETAKGTCIAGSIVETLDKIGCLGIVSTHLHGLFDLPLDTKSTVCKAMGTEYINGQPLPTWKMVDGVCRESLAFETAKREGVPEAIIQRAEDLYHQCFKEPFTEFNGVEVEKHWPAQAMDRPDDGHRIGASVLHKGIGLIKGIDELLEEVKAAINSICHKKLSQHYAQKNSTGPVEVQCFSIAARERPPPSTIGSSVVYVMFRSDKKIYVGETDDLDGRICTHRSKEGMQNATFLYFKVPGKSMACQLETLLIHQLMNKGFQLANIADGKHRNFGSSDISMETTSALH